MNPSVNNQPSQNPNEVEPPTNPTQTQASVAMPQQKKSHKKGIIASIISVAVVVLLAGGGYAAYALWYQNPDRVISTAVMKSITANSVIADSTINITSHTSDAKINLDLHNEADTSRAKFDAKFDYAYAGKSIDMDFEGVSILESDKMKSYFKMNNLTETLNTIMGQGSSSTAYSDMIEIIVPLLDSQWLSFDSSDTSAYDNLGLDTSNGVDQACVVSLSNKIKEDKSYAKELGDAYMNNAFIEVVENLGAKDGNLGYKVKLNRNKLVAFLENARDSKMVQGYRDCIDADQRTEFDKDVNKYIEQAGKTVDGEDKVQIELWIDRWSHQLKQTTMAYSDDKSTLEMKVDSQFNVTVDISEPDDAKSLDDIIASIRKAVLNSYGVDIDNFGSSLLPNQT